MVCMRRRTTIYLYITATMCLLMPRGVSAVELDRASLMQYAQQIDALITADQVAHAVRPHGRTDDVTFARRIYLESIGRIPSHAELVSFFESQAEDKRLALIDHLLQTRGYVSHQFNYWADLLRVKTRLNGGAPSLPYIDWLKQALRDNMPYDVFVRALITAEGAAWEAGNGATGYYIRDAGMPLENMANTVQLFLGTQISCAQCHDHPFDKWTRKDFFSLAAFTSQVDARGSSLQHTRAVKKILAAEMKTDQSLRRAVRMVRKGVGVGVRDKKKSPLYLPKDYQYMDGTAGDLVVADVLFGATIDPAADGHPRVLYAEWLTARDNERFTVVIANRLWARVMGVGLMDAVDHITDKTKPHNPALLSFLTTMMKDIDYDMRQFQQVLYYTQTYQRVAYSSAWDQADVYHYPGPLLHRLSAEQLWDSLLTLVMPDVDERQRVVERNFYQAYKNIQNMNPESLAEVVRNVARVEKETRRLREKVIRPLTLSVKKMVREDGESPQTVALWKKIKRERKKMKALKSHIESVMSGADTERMNMGDTQKKNRMGKKNRGDPRWRGLSWQMYRASELRMPMQAGHFLRQFGQSDREQIANANSAASVTQILALLNGFTQREVLRERSLLMENIRAAQTIDERVELIYLSILGRYPSPVDMKSAHAGVAAYGMVYYQDIALALLNTHEFMFVQ